MQALKLKLDEDVSPAMDAIDKFLSDNRDMLEKEYKLSQFKHIEKIKDQENLRKIFRIPEVQNKLKKLA